MTSWSGAAVFYLGPYPTVLLYVGIREGSSIRVNYDGVTLAATGLTVVGGGAATQPMVFYLTVAGTTTTIQVDPGTVPVIYPLSSPLPGTLVNNTITWPITIHGGGHTVVPPTPPTVI